MASHRLLEVLNQFDPTEADRVFGGEFALAPPDPSIALAPVKRVAIIAEAFLPKVDGVSKTAYLSLRYLQQTGREVIVIAPDYAPTHIGESSVYAMPSFGVWVAPETRVGLPHPQVMQRLEEFKPDLVHMFSPFILSLTGMAYARQAGIPVIANYQTDLPGYAGAYGWNFLSQMARDWLRFIHNNCHSTLAPSTWTMQQLHEWGYHRVRRWGRGVNSQRFNPNRRNDITRARLLNGRDPKSMLVVYVGPLAPGKWRRSSPAAALISPVTCSETTWPTPTPAPTPSSSPARRKPSARWCRKRSLPVCRRSSSTRAASPIWSRMALRGLSVPTIRRRSRAPSPPCATMVRSGGEWPIMPAIQSRTTPGKRSWRSSKGITATPWR